MPKDAPPSAADPVSPPAVLVSARVPAEVAAWLAETAKAEDRTVSRVVARLLSAAHRSVVDER